MMKNPESSLFRPDTCLDEERMLNYISGNLSPAEEHAVEKHLLNCELCSDAIEGIQLMKNPSDLKSINAELIAEIENSLLVDEIPVAKVMFPWRIAAAFALIFVSAATLWFILPKTNTEKLFTEEYQPYPSPAQTVTTPASTQVPTPDETPIEIKDVATVTKAEELQPTDNALAESENTNRDSKTEGIRTEEKVVATEEEAPSVIDREAGISETKVNTDKSKTEEVTNYSTVQTTNIDAAGKKPTKEAPIQKAVTSSKRNADVMNEQASDELPKDYYDDAMRLYQQEKFAEAAQLFDKIKLKPEAIFYSGVSYLSSDQPHLAIKRLKEYRTTKATTYTEASWWYEGLANLKLDKKKEASAAFKEVVKLNGEHTEKAQELLMKL